MGMRGADAIVEVMRSEGVTHVFGNPGSTEMPMIDAIAGSGDISYVLGLHESCVVAMAEGYAMASGRPAVVNVHTMSGLGNAIGMLTNARVNGTPLIVTAGHQHQKLLIGDPLLSHDLTGMARTVTKWQHEPRHADELGIVFRRAFNDVRTPPRGPVFVSVPVSQLTDPVELPVPGQTTIARSATAEGLDQIAQKMIEAGPEGAAIILGFEVVQEEAVEAAVDLAERLGVPVYGATNSPLGMFPPAHPLWHGMLPALTPGMRDTLARYRRILFIGGQVLQEVQYKGCSPMPDGVELYHLSSDGSWIGRAHATMLGAIGGLKLSIVALAQAVGRASPSAAAVLESARSARAEAIRLDEERVRALYGPAPIHPEAVVHAALRGATHDTIVVDEAVSGSDNVRRHHHWTRPRRMFSARQIIGWGMPAAVGVAIAHGGREPVLSINSDGGATFSPQAVWTAARERLPIVFIVMVNREYGILKRYLKALNGHSVRANDMRSVDLIDPPIDYVLQAQSYGVEALRVASADNLTEAVRTALRRQTPTLIEVPMAI